MLKLAVILLELWDLKEDHFINIINLLNSKLKPSELILMAFFYLFCSVNLSNIVEFLTRHRDNGIYTFYLR